MGLIDKYNCILCKYNKYNKNGDSCFNHQEKDEYGYPIEKCKSLSNIYYGKIANWFPFNIIEKIKDKIEEKRIEEFYADFNEDGTENSTMKHIWGIRSYMDLSSVPCGLLSMNDFDVTYLKDENKYILSVETALGFEDEHDKYEYMKWTLDKFTEWMEQNGYDTTKEFALHEVFTNGININTKFESLEDCYAGFKMMVNGFCSLEKEETKEASKKRCDPNESCCYDDEDK